MRTFLEEELKTKNGGFDKLNVMLSFMPVLEAIDEKELDNGLVKLNSFIVELIKRELTPQEEIGLLQGCKNYVGSDCATNERIEAMNYLFELEFLTIN